jgi:secretory phospholipase A2
VRAAEVVAINSLVDGQMSEEQQEAEVVNSAETIGNVGLDVDGRSDGRHIDFVSAGYNEQQTLPKDMVRMPGTKWCGPGWRTDKAQKFGGYAGTDRCCRHHDLGCPLSIGPGERLYGLLNTHFHSLMHCSCDDRFRSCLKMAHTQAADIVGNLFFNVGSTPCFVFKIESVCKSWNWWGQCLVREAEPVAVFRDAVPY